MAFLLNGSLAPSGARITGKPTTVVFLMVPSKTGLILAFFILYGVPP